LNSSLLENLKRLIKWGAFLFPEFVTPGGIEPPKLIIKIDIEMKKWFKLG